MAARGPDVSRVTQIFQHDELSIDKSSVVEKSTWYRANMRAPPAYVGNGTPYSRAYTRDGGYGFVMNDDGGRDDVLFHLDTGSVVHLTRSEADSAVICCRAMNRRKWCVIDPSFLIEGNADPITAAGKYPVFAAHDCVLPAFGELLSEEFSALRTLHEWSLYHDSDGSGEWSSAGMGAGGAEEEEVHIAAGRDCSSSTGETPAAGEGSSVHKTQVHVLYGAAQTDELPFQNPCGVTEQWSPDTMRAPFVAMPPVCRMLRDLVVLGNPAPRDAFGDIEMGDDYLGLAALTEYKHRNGLEAARGPAALAWHYDKSLGIETMCVSVPLPTESSTASGLPGDPLIGRKTIGLGGRCPIEGGCGSNTAGSFATMAMPVNSCWLANAKAVYHAVGNDDERSRTLVLRTLVTKKKCAACCTPSKGSECLRRTRRGLGYQPRYARRAIALTTPTRCSPRLSQIRGPLLPSGGPSRHAASQGYRAPLLSRPRCRRR